MSKVCTKLQIITKNKNTIIHSIYGLTLLPSYNPDGPISELKFKFSVYVCSLLIGQRHCGSSDITANSLSAQSVDQFVSIFSNFQFKASLCIEKRDFDKKKCLGHDLTLKIVYKQITFF